MTSKSEIRSLLAKANSVTKNEAINTFAEAVRLYGAGREAAAMGKLEELRVYMIRAGEYQRKANEMIRNQAVLDWADGRCRYKEAMDRLEWTGLDKWEAGRFIDDWKRPEPAEYVGKPFTVTGREG